MKVFLFIIFLTSFAYSNSSKNIVDFYRTYGIKAVQQELELKLQEKDYWLGYLQDIDTTNGYYESIRYIMICQKNMKNMEVYDTSTRQKLFSTSVFTGKNNGDKQREGDLKTPIGAYMLEQKITKLDPFYGPLAITTNYPNIYDKVRGKTGSGIWIHGLPNDEQRDKFTKGCIALDNKKIKKLDKTINIDNSVLLISEHKFKSASKEDISIILSDIYKWKYAWSKSDISSYLSFYDEEFKRSNGQELDEFKRYKKRIFQRKEDKKIKFSNINIIPYPNDKDKKLYKVVMDELYKTNSYKFEGKKELYIKIDKDKISILTES
jgi:murein L,D-transpeptidase YafK